MTPALHIDVVRLLLAGAAPGGESVRAHVEATLLELAGPAMNLGQLNRLLTLRLESERLAELLAEPDMCSPDDIEAARLRSLTALDELAAAFGLTDPDESPDH